MQLAQVKKNTIFLVISDLSYGGQEKVMATLAAEWSRHFDVHVICIFSARTDYPLPDNVKLHGLNVNNHSFITKIFSTIGAFFKFRQLLSLYLPKAILSFAPVYNMFTIVSSFCKHQRVFVSERNNLKRFSSRSVYYCRKIIYPHAVGIIAQTQVAKERMYKQIRHKNITVIPNPVDIEKFAPCKENFAAKRIVNIGRLANGKGLEDLIEVFEQIHSQYHDWSLDIIGDGLLKEQLLNQIRALNAESYIFIRGATVNPEKYLSAASIFAFPSYAEGLPNALCEAMCAGLACVSYDCDAGPADLIVNNKNGLLIAVGDKDALRESLIRLMTSPTLRKKLGANAQLVRQRLNRAAICQRYLNFILPENCSPDE